MIIHKIIFRYSILVFICNICLILNSEAQHKDQRIDINNEITKYLIKNDCLMDTTLEVRIVFIFKIDSVGEVHSCHLLNVSNVKELSKYPLCYHIETYFNLLSLYKEFKHYSYGAKYVYANYIYQQKIE
jgi:hypothetical protein